MDSLTVDSIPTAAPAPLRRSTRVHRPPDRYSFTPYFSLIATLSSIPIPSSYKQAMEHECWHQVIEAEFFALEEIQTWDVVSRPPSVKPLRSCNAPFFFFFMA